MPPDNSQHNEIMRLLRENQELLKENNKLLRKLKRNSIVGITMTAFWYLILIGVPFFLYFYVVEPYFDAFGANYEIFRQGMAEIPGFKGLEQILPKFGG